MAKEKVTLYLDDTIIRLLVIHDQQIMKWATLPLEPGLIGNNIVTNDFEVAARIRQLFLEHDIKTTKVSLSISGRNTMSRPMVFPQLPKEMFAEVVTREARNLLPIPVEKLYLSWQLRPAPSDKTAIFMAGVPRATVDTLTRTMRMAGLTPVFIGLKPLLLTRLIKEPNGIIIDVQNGEFDIVVMSDGQPQPVRTISFAREELGWPEKLAIVVEEVQRTISFFNTNNPAKAIVASVPIFASGELISKPGRSESLAQETGHPVLPIASPLAPPPNFSFGLYMANMASVMGISGKDSGFRGVDIDALPVVYQPKGISLINVIALPAAIVLAIVLAFVYILNQQVSRDIAAADGKVKAAEQAYRQRASQMQALDNNNKLLEAQISNATSQIGLFSAAGGSLAQQTRIFNEDIKTTMAALPGTIMLKSVSCGGNITTIGGQAPDVKEILAYVKKLGENSTFNDIVVTAITRNDDGTLEFELLGNHAGRKVGVAGFELMVNKLPADVSILELTYSGGLTTIRAGAAVRDSVLAYIRQLEGSGRFGPIIVEDMTKIDSGQFEFSLILEAGE